MTGWLKGLKTFFEMIKVEHSIFALPFAYLGLILAEKSWPSGRLWFWVTLAMVSFRSMGMALNRIIDARIDVLNPRTRDRAIPAGKIKLSAVWIITAVCFAIFEYSTYRLSSLCFLLSPIPVFLAGLYPFTKRFTWFSHLILGIILGIAPYGAWLAGRDEFSWVPGAIMIGVMAWVSGFDVIYALQDIDFDRSHGLYSFPARFGFQKSVMLARALHGVTILSWFFAGVLAGCGWFYFAGILVAAVFLIREHWLIRSFGLQKIEEAFFMMNGAISVIVFAAVAGEYTLFKAV